MMKKFLLVASFLFSIMCDAQQIKIQQYPGLVVDYNELTNQAYVYTYPSVMGNYDFIIPSGVNKDFNERQLRTIDGCKELAFLIENTNDPKALESYRSDVLYTANLIINYYNFSNPDSINIIADAVEDTLDRKIDRNSFVVIDSLLINPPSTNLVFASNAISNKIGGLGILQSQVNNMTFDQSNSKSVGDISASDFMCDMFLGNVTLHTELTGTVKKRHSVELVEPMTTGKDIYTSLIKHNNEYYKVGENNYKNRNLVMTTFYLKDTIDDKSLQSNITNSSIINIADALSNKDNGSIIEITDQQLPYLFQQNTFTEEPFSTQWDSVYNHKESN